MLRAHRLIVALVFLAMTVFARVSAAEPVAVTACGQHVDGDGFLTADLDCSASPFVAVVMNQTGALSLNGFTITKGHDAYAIVCKRNCTLQGPGLISGGAYGVTAVRRVIVDGVDFANPENEAVSSSKGSVRVANSAVSVTGRGAVQSQRKITLENVMITGAGADGLSAHAAVHGRSVTLTNCSITGCNLTGVKAKSLMATNTNITGNGTDAECGVSLACTDIDTAKRPRLVGSTCETSLVTCKECDYASPPPLTAETDPVWFNWGVCALD